jgi:hypothetical protein
MTSNQGPIEDTAHLEHKTVQSMPFQPALHGFSTTRSMLKKGLNNARQASRVP